MLTVALLGGGAFLVAVPSTAPAERVIGSFETSLAGRTPGQTANARLSASKLHGLVIEPGAAFSFNQAVGGWTRAEGYRKAPVSFDGQLVLAWGGGVCQTSTTLYNAALLGGLEVLERHPHQFAPSYAPPGRDAAVAFDDIDLRLRNPHPFPLRVEAGVRGERLWVRLLGRGDPPAVSVHSEVRDLRRPMTFTNRRPSGAPWVRTAGMAGFEVLVWRTQNGRRQLISADDYPPMHRLIEYR
jgi:vancomycin resistance protein YoaR